MSFEANQTFAKRFYYEAGATQVYQVPKGNLFSDMNLHVNLEIDIATNPSVNVPDFQVGRAIQKLEIFKNQTSVWSMSGEALAAMFTFNRGAQATSNASIAVSVATNVQGKLFLMCAFSPEDAANPSDYAMDTRFDDYEISITWRNLTAAGTLFGTVAGTITANQGENYIDLTLEKLSLRPSPDGSQDKYADPKFRPLMRGLRETITDITSTQALMPFDISKFKTYRRILMWATHVANTLQEVGLNTILTDKIVLKDTQEHIYHTIQAAYLREKTSQLWGVGSSLASGVYDLPLTRFGNLVDQIVSNQAIELQLMADVTKLANSTKLHLIFDTTERP